MEIDKLKVIKVNLLQDFTEVIDLEATFYSQDINSAVITLEVVENDKTVDLSTRNMTGSIAIKTADGAVFSDDNIVIDGNKMSYVLTREQLLRAGRAYGEFFIYENNKKISAVNFKFRIKLSIVDGKTALLSADQITFETFLQKYISEHPDLFKSTSTNGLTTMPYYEAELANYHATPIDYPFVNFMSDYLQMAVEGASKVERLSNEVNTLKNSGGAVSLLNGRTALIIGDSLSEYNGRTSKNYHTFIAERSGMIVNNSSFSGTSFQSRVNVASDINVQPDLIVIMLGTNDWSGVNGIQPLGTKDHEVGTVAGTIYSMLKQLINKMPLTPIYTITPPPRIECNPLNEVKNDAGYTLGELADMINEISRQFSVPCYDLYHNSGINVWNRAANEAYFTPEVGTADGLHLNFEGHKLISYKIQSFLEMNAPSTHIDYVPTAVNPIVIDNGDGTYTAEVLPYAIAWDQNSFRINVDKTKLDIEGRNILKVEYEGHSILNAQGTLDNSPYWYTVQSFPAGDFYNNTPVVEPFVQGLELLNIDGEMKSYMPVVMKVTYR